MTKRTIRVSPELEKKRREIDRVDRELLGLLNQRIRLVREAIAIKRKTGEKLRILEREKKIIQSLTSRNRGPLKDAELKRIFRAILAMGRRHVTPRRSPGGRHR